MATSRETSARKPPASASADRSEAESGTTPTAQEVSGAEELRATAAAAARLPLVAAREAVRTAHGLPAYVGLGGLAVVGVLEWPFAAAAGVGVAALRRWGPAPLHENGNGKPES